MRDLRYGLALLDRYGRVADRATLRALAWRPGQALVLTLTAGSVLAVSGPDPSVRVGNDGYLRLPVDRMGISPADLLAISRARAAGAQVRPVRPAGP